MKCALCADNGCGSREKICTKTREDSIKEYAGETKDLLTTAACLEAEHYMKLTRVEETIEFALRMGYKKIGIAFCIGLAKEAQVLQKILEKNFKVVSVCCKNGSISKEVFDMPKVKEGKYEASCNPIGQAIELNNSETELNLIVGLCVGHDIIFTQHSKAPVSTLIVKDRVLAHNPVGALYSGYYLKKKFNIE